MWRILVIVFDIAYGFEYVDSFRDQEIVFNHLVVDYNSDAVYVGAVNNIYQLTPNLRLVRKVITGPVSDSDQCSFDCELRLERKDNYNKALIIDNNHERLITCGSVFQGMCTVRRLSNIYIARDVPKPVVANDPTASTVVFIAPGPPDPNTTLVMYTGATFTNNFARRYEVPAVSSRSLEDDKLFDMATTYCEFCNADQATGTKLHINAMYRDSFIVDYVYGFSSGSFSYFLTTQPKSGGGRHSKIIRICHRDYQYHSYTEIPVSCTLNENIDYKIVVAGFVSTLHDDLAKEFGISSDEKVLYALFHLEGDKPTSYISALCIYTIQEIDEKISAGIEKCFKGQAMRGLEHVWPNKQCVQQEIKMNGSDFCGSNVNSPLGIEIPIAKRPLCEFKETVTAVAGRSLNQCSLIYVGTSQGHLKELIVATPKLAYEQDKIVIDEGFSINKDLFFDSQQEYLYVMTKYQVNRIKIIQDCGNYRRGDMMRRPYRPFSRTIIPNSDKYFDAYVRPNSK